MEDFNHQLAIKLSRALNTLNPNDLLAQRVTDIAKTNSVEGFIKGAFRNSISAILALTLHFSGAGIWQVSGHFSSRVACRNIVACKTGGHRRRTSTS
jgi:hypothetical protein